MNSNLEMCSFFVFCLTQVSLNRLALTAFQHHGGERRSCVVQRAQYHAVCRALEHDLPADLGKKCDRCRQNLHGAICDDELHGKLAHTRWHSSRQLGTPSVNVEGFRSIAFFITSEIRGCIALGALFRELRPLRRMRRAMPQISNFIRHTISSFFGVAIFSVIYGHASRSPSGSCSILCKGSRLGV